MQINFSIVCILEAIQAPDEVWGTRLSYSLRLCLVTGKLAGMRLGGYTLRSMLHHHFCSLRLHIAGGWKLVGVLGWLGMSTPLLEFQ